MASNSNTTVVLRVVEEIWNGGDLDVADVLFAPSYVNHGGLIPDLVRGPEAIKIGAALYRTAFPGLHISVELLTASGDMVELRWVAHRTLSNVRARYLGTLTGTTLSRLVGGQIGESWTNWDREGVLRRQGVAAS